MTRLLIRNAGHEVRTPLNIIINYLEIALEEPLEDHVRNHLENSLQASKSLVFVVNDLLNLTEAENAEFKVSEEDVNLRLVVSDVVSAFTHESAKRNVDVLLEDDQDVLKIVRSDPTKLRQVVSNLLGNAIKHSNGGKIRIGLNILSSFEQNSVVEMSFDDEGSGLSEVHLDSIFQDFEQILDDEDEDYGDAEKQASRLQESVEKRLKRPLQIGLGLAIVARFVRLNYGQISISSAGEGHGTRVSLKIPIRTVSEDGFPNTTKLTRKIMPALRRNTLIPNTYQEPASPLVPDPGGISLDDILTQSSASSDLPSTPRHTISTPSASSNGGHNIYASLRQDLQRNQRKLKVLVAEDNPLNSKLLQTHLTRKGHYVWVAADGQACLDAFKDDPGAFDIILMDLQVVFSSFLNYLPAHLALLLPLRTQKA
jgi:CheY-like chemotaxis protein